MRVPKKVWIPVVIAGVVAAVVALFEWNWLRAPLSSYMSARIGRPFAIAGDLRVELSRQPVVSADAVSLGNMAGSAEPVMADAQRVTIRVDPVSLFGNRVSLPEVTLVQPRLLLERDADGHANWEFTEPAEPPQVGRLTIEDGVVRYANSSAATDVTLNVVASAASTSGPTPVHFSGTGRVRDQPVTIEGEAASLLALEQGERPYRLNAQVRSGDTRAHFDGTVVPHRPDNLDGTLTLQGRDLSQLYPIVPVPFPWTPPYRLNGQLKHGGKVWTFHDFTGKVGDSDLAGNFALDVGKQRPLVDADLVSTRLDYKDLGGLVGLPPTHEPPAARTAAQNKDAMKRARSGRALPDRPYDTGHFNAVDAKVRFKGKRFIASNLPLDDMNATLELRDGVLTLQPLDFGIAGGRVASTLTLDAREKLIRTKADVTVRSVELKEILPALKPPKGSAGKASGRARFTATGNSVADMLASSNGDAAIISWGGEASELAVVLTNLDLARAAPLLMRGDTNTPIRCVVADFTAKDGTLIARSLVMDTEKEKILGEGSVDFTKERYDLTLNAQSKRPSLVALRGPIIIDGTFKAPQVRPATGPIAARVGASVALGAALTPLAALLPLIDVGGSEDADCRALMQEAQDNVKARIPAAPEKLSSTPAPPAKLSSAQ
jgi:AsmA family protein